jgi:hypothetical protein
LTKPSFIVIINFMKEKYKPVSGRQEGQPEVLVRESAIRRWGEPEVDFENLAEMVRDAGLPAEKTRIKLFSGRVVGDEPSLRRLAMGGRIPLSKTIYSGVGLNNRAAGLPHRANLPPKQKEQLEDHYTATMEKLTHNVLRAAGVRGAELHKREHELFAKHAGDIQFKHPSPEA